MAARKMKLSRGYKVFLTFDYILMFFIAFVTILPFVYVISISLLSQEGLMKYGFTLIPREFSLVNYKYIITRNISTFANGYKNTIFITVVGTAMNLLVTAGVAYPLSKKNLPARNLITMFLFFTMLFGGGLVPLYLVVKGTGLMDTRWALIIPELVNVWNMLILRNFFMTIPDSIEESAQIDGCSPMGILFRIILPLSLPSIMTIGLFYAVYHWNNWFSATIYISDAGKKPMMQILRDILLLSKLGEEDSSVGNTIQSITVPSVGIENASIVIAILPILAVYPYIQKYFVKGVLVGSVKG